jgi:prepilin-type N-terminal cleavage/methylation domain-containing protein
MKTLGYVGTKSAFTLIEILLAVAALTILAGITVFALNPGKQLADTRNAERQIDIATILSAIDQYALDNHGSLPAAIPNGTLTDCTTVILSDAFTICKTGGSCTVALSELTNNKKYLSDIPVDPITYSDTETGYNVIKNTDNNNRVAVCAPGAENGAVIYTPH